MACLAMVVVMITHGGSPAAAQSLPGSVNADLKYLEGLRQKGQWVSAATYCQRKVRETAGNPESRVQYAVEWIRTLAEQAWQSPPEEGEPYWNDALGVAQRYEVDYPDDPRRVLVQVQHGLVYAARGRWLKRQQEVTERPDFTHALTDLRQASRRQRQIDQQLASATRARVGNGLSRVQRLSLRNNVRQYLARAYLEMAECFAADSADRINACSQGLDALRKIPEKQLSPSHRWDWYLARIRAHVLMQRHPEAEQLIDQMLNLSPPLDQRARAEAERARCRLSEGRPAEGLKALGALPMKEIGPTVAAELEYLKLCCLVSLWQQTQRKEGPSAIATWRNQAVKQLDKIENLKRDYWFRRAERLLARAVAQSRTGDENAQLLKRTADDNYRRGALDEADRAYQQAAERAADAGDQETALQMNRLAAAVQKEQGDLHLAVNHLRAAANRFSTSPQAAETHWMAILGQAELVRRAGEDRLHRDAAKTTYQEMLAEHLAQWPRSGSAIEAHAWSARSERQRERWEAAIEHCQAVLRQSPHRADMIRVLGQCYSDWLDQRRQADGETTVLARRASDQLTRYGDGLPAETETVLLNAMEQIRAEIEIRYLPARRTRAAERLRRLLDDQTTSKGDDVKKTEADWRRNARMLLVEEAALAGNWNAARTGVDSIGSLQWHDARQWIGRLEEANRKNQVVELGRLESQILQQVDTSKPLSAVDQRQWHRWQVRALVRSGRTVEALAVIEPMAAQFPTDGDIQEQYAQLLAARNHADALRQWRQVLSSARPTTDRWYRAKYAIAELHYRMDDRARASRMIRLLRTLHPDMGGKRSRTRFEALLNQCESHGETE